MVTWDHQIMQNAAWWTEKSNTYAALTQYIPFPPFILTQLYPRNIARDPRGFELITG